LILASKFGLATTKEQKPFRPTGIDFDRVNNRLLVTDKDNHRVCVFSVEGNFIMSFGSEGHLNGEFNYPWGVAVSSDGEYIAVADSKNHRVQLFSRGGEFIRKFTVFEVKPFEYKNELDRPRGICFDNTGK
jgi:tripartite motif-containing protein 71